MSELDAFEAKVRQNIKQLSSPDPKRRHQAATWLGEAGDPSAITRLRQIYEEDHDPKVRAAAAYSLGMFRALEEGLAGPNQEKIVVQLEDIALKGKIGRRTRISVPFLRKLLVGLIVSALILLAFNFLIWPEIKDQISVSGLLGNRGTTASNSNDADVSGYLNALQSDVEALRSQYLNILGGGAIDCAIDFNMPTPLDASSQSGVTEVIDGLNQVRTDFD
ncbi:MAG: HEAT repeat domain-containing protein, partial [Anaerolineae bacterium]|nr:HEAT repeat domain-containing protein [Anaerolineae bacterium]